MNFAKYKKCTEHLYAWQINITLIFDGWYAGLKKRMTPLQNTEIGDSNRIKCMDSQINSTYSQLSVLICFKWLYHRSLWAVGQHVRCSSWHNLSFVINNNGQEFFSDWTPLMRLLIKMTAKHVIWNEIAQAISHQNWITTNQTMVIQQFTMKLTETKEAEKTQTKSKRVLAKRLTYLQFEVPHDRLDLIAVCSTAYPLPIRLNFPDPSSFWFIFYSFVFGWTYDSFLFYVRIDRRRINIYICMYINKLTI